LNADIDGVESSDNDRRVHYFPLPPRATLETGGIGRQARNRGKPDPRLAKNLRCGEDPELAHPVAGETMRFAQAPALDRAAVDYGAAFSPGTGHA
jgi:hypothetical protein